MSHAVQARRLKDHIASLETMTRFVLATLALGSGVYTYLGVRSLLDGSATVVFFAAIIYSVSVSVAIYGFWTYLIRFLPEMRDGGSRLALLGIMAVGSAMIVAMASWLNAAALAGSAAVEQHLAVTLEDYTADLDQAHGNALGALSLLPDIQRAGERFARLAEDEQNRRADRHVRLGQRRAAAQPDVGADEGARRRRSRPRAKPSRTSFKRGPGASRRDARPGLGARRDRAALRPVRGRSGRAHRRHLRAGADLDRAIRHARRRRPLRRLHRAGRRRRSADLAGRQDQVMATIRTSVEAQSKALSDAAAEILAQPKVAERRFVPLTSAEAVLRYASDFIPSWAGAISIDLLPAVLVGIMAVVHAAMRRGEDDAEDADRITAGDMLRSLDLHEMLVAKRQAAAKSARGGRTATDLARAAARKRGRRPRTSRR